MNERLQCGRWTKTNWPKSAHHTHGYRLVPLCGYRLSTGPTEGLSSWWPSDLSLPGSSNSCETITEASRLPAQIVIYCFFVHINLLTLFKPTISRLHLGQCYDGLHCWVIHQEKVLVRKKVTKATRVSTTENNKTWSMYRVCSSLIPVTQYCDRVSVTAASSDTQLCTVY